MYNVSMPWGSPYGGSYVEFGGIRNSGTEFGDRRVVFLRTDTYSTDSAA